MTKEIKIAQETETTDSVISKAVLFSHDFEVEPKKGEYGSLLRKTLEFIDEEIKETKQAVADGNRAEILDGFGDIAFIALNGIYKQLRIQGYDHRKAELAVAEVMLRICKANLGKKQPDGTILYRNGKVQKPSKWSPPCYQDMLE